MRRFGGMRNLDVYHARLDADAIGTELAGDLTAKARARLDATVTKARTSDSLKALRKLTRTIDGQVRIISDPPLIQPLEELPPTEDADAWRKAIAAALRSYRTHLLPDRRVTLEGYRLVDLARKVVGVGSVGTRAWIALLVGRDERDPLFLQFKQAEASVLEPFAGASPRPVGGSRGDRRVPRRRPRLRPSPR